MKKMIIETKIFKHITNDQIKKHNDYIKSKNITIKWQKDISFYQVILGKRKNKTFLIKEMYL